MYNLLIALGLAVAGFVLGQVVAGGWIGGLVPGLLAGGVAYVLLARRTGQKVEAIARAAAACMQARDVPGARAALESALPLGRWQFLVVEQIHAQLGQLDYLEAMQPFIEAIGRGVRPPAVAKVADKLGAARGHLERSWKRDWRGRSLLAIVHWRFGELDAALQTLAAVEASGTKEPLYWGIRAYLLNDAKRREDALGVVGKGLSAIDKSRPLLAVQEALSNHARPHFPEIFGEGWINFFPDHVTREQLLGMAKAQGLAPANAELPDARAPMRSMRPVGPTPPPPRGGRGFRG